MRVHVGRYRVSLECMGQGSSFKAKTYRALQPVQTVPCRVQNQKDKKLLHFKKAQGSLAGIVNKPMTMKDILLKLKCSRPHIYANV